MSCRATNLPSESEPAPHRAEAAAAENAANASVMMAAASEVPARCRGRPQFGSEVAFQIDRVVFAWAHLEALAGAFASVGLTTDYGGIHTNGATHMATLGFGDGSYLELISVRQPGQQAPVWQHHIATNGGLCAWSVSVGDVHRVSDRLRTLQVPVDGPRSSNRRRPDGETIESEIAFVGAEGMGSLHPFMITDRTPRENRVRVSESLDGSGLAGLDSVVLAVPDVVAAAIEFQRVYGAGEPVDIDADAFPGRTVQLHGEPVAITSPASAGDWVARRIATYGPTPCACLIRATDMAASRDRLPLTEPARFGDREVAWIDSEKLRPLRIGVVPE